MFAAAFQRLAGFDLLESKDLVAHDKCGPPVSRSCNHLQHTGCDSLNLPPFEDGVLTTPSASTRKASVSQGASPPGPFWRNPRPAHNRRGRGAYSRPLLRAHVDRVPRLVYPFQAARPRLQLPKTIAVLRVRAVPTHFISGFLACRGNSPIHPVGRDS
jgi:hypothetical protein